MRTRTRPPAQPGGRPAYIAAALELLEALDQPAAHLDPDAVRIALEATLSRAELAALAQAAAQDPAQVTALDDRPTAGERRHAAAALDHAYRRAVDHLEHHS